MSAVKPAPLPVDRRRRHQTMAEAAVAELREAIYSGELPAGTPLRLEEPEPLIGHLADRGPVLRLHLLERRPLGPPARRQRREAAVR